MAEPTYVDRQIKDNVVVPLIPHERIIESFPTEKVDDTPEIVTAIQLSPYYQLDEAIALKVQAVDEYIRELMEKEGLRNNVIGYRQILARLTARLSKPMELLLQQGQNNKVLDFLFQEASLSRELSGKTYFNKFKERIRNNRKEMIKNRITVLIDKLLK